MFDISILILTWLWGFQDKLLYLVVFSLYPSLFWELRVKRNLKKISCLTRKLRGHVRILVYRMWPNIESCCACHFFCSLSIQNVRCLTFWRKYCKYCFECFLLAGVDKVGSLADAELLSIEQGQSCGILLESRMNQEERVEEAESRPACISPILSVCNILVNKIKPLFFFTTIR